MAQAYQKIVVAIDGSTNSNVALKKAITIALRDNAELNLVHVIDERAFKLVSAFEQTLESQVVTYAKNIFKDYEKTAITAGCKKVMTSIEFGNPKSVLATTIFETYDPDLIILGAVGLNTIEDLVIGSVTEYVTTFSKCDTLVVKLEPS